MKKIKLISMTITLAAIFSINTFAMKPTNNNNFNNAKININNDKDNNNKDNNNAINSNTINNKNQDNNNNINLNTINNDNDSDNENIINTNSNNKNNINTINAITTNNKNQNNDNKTTNNLNTINNDSDNDDENIANEEYDHIYEKYAHAHRKNFHIPNSIDICIVSRDKVGDKPIKKTTPFDDLKKDKVNIFSCNRYNDNDTTINIYPRFYNLEEYNVLYPDENFKAKKYHFIKFWDDDLKTNENGLNNLTEIKEEKSKEEKEIKKEKSKKEKEEEKSYFFETEYYENEDSSISNKIKSITIYEKPNNINLIKKMSKLIFDKEGFLRLKFIYAPYHQNFKYKGEKKYLKDFQPKAFVAIYTKKFKPTNFDYDFYKDNIRLNLKDLRNAMIYFNEYILYLEFLDENDLDGEDSVENYGKKLSYWFHRMNLNYNDLEAINDLSTLDYWDELDPNMRDLRKKCSKYLKFAKSRLV